ncbi:hypothetical protein DFH09DRAFT_161226 [Mycena vulgaris]|nr:hypothetical protein DFH09DRAFT_161226 [Mycena vulgaris]
MLGHLVAHERRTAAASNTKHSLQLVYHLCDNNLKSLEGAASALWRITLQLVSCLRDANIEVIETVEADLPACLPELLGSPSVEVRTLVCNIVGELARHKTTASAILDANPCEELVSLSGFTDPTIRTSALIALAKLSGSRGGASAIAATSFIMVSGSYWYLSSPDREVRFQTRVILDNLSRYTQGTLARGSRESWL